MARELVVLSAGPLGTPQVLERSGVGNPNILKTAGVPIIVDLPGVGHDYQDHQMLVVVYNSSLAIEQSVDSIVNGNLNTTQLIESNSGILSWNGIETFAKLRPSEAEIEGFAPGLRKMWDRDYAQNPNKPLGIVILMAG
jgi:choline dehydrogenase-like flavoprotein